MALMQVSFFSESLGVVCAMNVILPQASSGRQIGIQASGEAAGAGHPTLWLLHGLSDDHSIWLRRTAIERYVAPLGLAVVMPAVNRSYYADMRMGPAYWQFISEELPTLARQFFRLSSRREDNFVAGLSMGGYGAFKLALNHPDRFAAAASLSGALDPLALGDRWPERQREWEQIFGQPPALRPEEDLFGLAQRLKTSAHPLLPLYQCCGDKDFLLEDNRRFRDHAVEQGLNLIYDQTPGYGHSWDYWDLSIQRVLQWLPLTRPGA